MILLAADLDRTLIYSAAAVALAGPQAMLGELVPVEFRDGVAVSFLTAAAGKLLADLPIIPVTTRSLEQYRRVRLPGPPPKFAVAGNGGHLLVDGVPDPGWTELPVAAPAVGCPAVGGGSRAGPDQPARLATTEWTDCSATPSSTRPMQAADDQEQLRQWAEPNGWLTSWQGRKLYLVPRPLTKSAAVAEIRARTNAKLVYAAGDSGWTSTCWSTPTTASIPATANWPTPVGPRRTCTG